jgi:Zn-finger nucleic acid-binding protein
MRKCPVCKTAELSRQFLEAGLPAYECSKCSGLWIAANEYLAWVKSQNHQPIDEVDIQPPVPRTDAKRALICPDCGHILLRYKIWPDIEFHLDRCANCNGVWFDLDEWEVLKAHHMHDKVNLFFTESWQQKLRQEETHRRFEHIYLDRFGLEDYAEIKRIRAWIRQHPHGEGLLAYLTDEDPYRG